MDPLTPLKFLLGFSFAWLTFLGLIWLTDERKSEEMPAETDAFGMFCLFGAPVGLLIVVFGPPAEWPDKVTFVERPEQHVVRE